MIATSGSLGRFHALCAVSFEDGALYALHARCFKFAAERDRFSFSSASDLCLKQMAGSACFLARFLQRFPRLRAAELPRNGEDQAKELFTNFLKIWVSALGPLFATSCLCECLLKECASRQEKPSHCNENSAPANTHIRDLAGNLLCRSSR